MSNKDEDIFSGIPFGKWNLLYISIVCLQQASGPAQYYSSIFADMPIGFRCIDDNTRQSNITFDNNCFQMAGNIENDDYNISQHKCLFYEFDTSQVKSTFTSEFQLVCDRAWVSSMYPIILPIGSFIGTLFQGASDKWGRVNIIRISSTIHAVGVFIVGLAIHEYLVLLGRFLVGLTYPILNCTSVLLCHETTPPNLRSTVGFLMLAPFSLCLMVLGVVAYFIREWKMLYLITSFPVFIIPFIALVLDKSPRWLIQQGRINEAKIVMHNAAKMNGGTVNFDFKIIEKESSMESNDHKVNSNYISEMFSSVKHLTKQLYGTTTMLKISFIMPILLFLSGIVFFGVPLNANSFTTNPYLYIIMIGTAELPSAFLGPLAMKYFGNIKTGMSLFIITSGCMLGTLLVPESLWWIKWIFVMLSMPCLTAILNICFLLISELFPTTLRSTGHGMSNTACYAGFFFCTFINSAFISQTWWAFNTMCGTCCVIAAVLICLLPETQGLKLCETTNDVNDREYNRVSSVSEKSGKNKYF